jgi:subtilisin-like proprotein convertase family protein
MENQTLIAVFPGSWNFDMASHEFGHHWFGDLITCATWADIWLNESFATYCEALLLEYLGGPSAYQNRINEHYNYYRNANNNKAIYNPLFINYTPPKGQIFDELFYFPVVYSKGGCVLYMLRHVLGDTMFFNVLRSYLNDPNFRFKNATTDDFTAKINQVTGQDYTWFIDEWIKQRNHPKYYNVYKKDSIGISQWQLNFTTSQDLSFSPFHKMPIELKVMFPNNTDTLLKVLNEWNGQNFTFNLNRRPDSVQFDPGNKIILKETRYDWITGSVSQCSSTAPKPITDNNITKDTIEIFQNGIIKDIKVNLNISHQNDGDLTLILRNPSFGNLTLSQFNGEGGQNFINTIFDDTAALSITQGIPPYTGRYKPQSGLSLFYNKQLSGKWILQIFDNKTGNQGTLLNWCIQVAYYNPVVIKETETEIVKEFKLFQNYPNPFNPVTNIRFDIPKSSFVSIKVYDITGKDVETIVNENIQAGKYETQWDGSKYSSGVYFYKINVRHGGSSTVDYMDTKRMILIK